MGFMKSIIMLAIVIFAIYYFLPDTFEIGREWATDKYQEKFQEKLNIDTELTYIDTDYGRDYGMIYNDLPCVKDRHCEKYFNIKNITCSNHGTCYISNGGNSSE